MRKANIILLLVLCLALTGAIFYIFRMEQANAPKPTATAAPTATPVPTATPAPTATPVPTATPEPTQVPTAIPTAAPVITPAPITPATPEPVYETEGIFRSDTGAWLNMVVKWKLVRDGEKTTVHMDAYAESYSLICTGVNDVEFIIGSKSVKASSGVINVDYNMLTETKIGSADIEVEPGQKVDVFVTWTYKGTYGSSSGVKAIDTIQADTEIYIP